jgi:hypothetical protein
MKKLGRSFAAALLLFAMTAVTLADGQMGTPLTTPTTTTQTSTTYQGQVYTSPATSPTTDVTSQIYSTATATGLMLFQTFSSVL